MEEQIEKSCWGITAWAVAIVVGLFGLAALVSDPPHVERQADVPAPVSHQANAGAATTIGN